LVIAGNLTILALAAIELLIYLKLSFSIKRWLWTRKFKRKLLKTGMPRDLVNELATHYNESISSFTSFRNIIRLVNAVRKD
jgi:hypothetical protein